MSEKTEKTISVAEAAKLIGCAPRQLRYWDEAGDLKPVGRDQRGRRRYDQAQIAVFMAEHPRYARLARRTAYFDVFTTGLVAQILDCSVKTVERRVAEGAIRCSYVGNRAVCTRPHLDAYLESHPSVRATWPAPCDYFLTPKRAALYLGVGVARVRAWSAPSSKRAKPLLAAAKTTKSGRPLYDKAELQCFSVGYPKLVPRSHAFDELKTRSEEAWTEF